MNGSVIGLTIRQTRLRLLSRIVVCLSVLLMVKVFLSILMEYRWYFPADYDASAFLSGRRYTFSGFYRWAFYVHIISSPLSLILGTFLVVSGKRARQLPIHRSGGKLQALIVLGFVVPSGFMMARHAYAGPVATYGFASLSILTGFSMAVSIYFARARQIHRHQYWAGFCYVLLCSPLLLRIINGATSVAQYDSEGFYRLNAWCSWLIPLAFYVGWRYHQNRQARTFTVAGKSSLEVGTL